jgi:hypothetical protein
MRPPSLAEVGAAKADGREAAFESLGRSERYAVILPLLKARTPQQRAERLRVTMAELATSGQAPEPRHCCRPPSAPDSTCGVVPFHLEQ